MSRVAGAPTLAEAARRYASHGIPVFPCVPGGKQPLTPTGFHDASASRAVVERWWRRTPEANIGLPTGVAVGVVVVDVDVHDSGSGYAAFDHAHRKGLTQGWGWLVRTPSGGMHAYYPPTGDEQRCWQTPAAHIDFRGDGGYVIAPPSRIEVRGKLTPYEVIAVAEHKATPLDATLLRGFLDPSTTNTESPYTVAAAGDPPRAPGQVDGRTARGRSQPGPVLGRVPARRGRAPDRGHDRHGRYRRSPSRAPAGGG